MMLPSELLKNKGANEAWRRKIKNLYLELSENIRQKIRKSQKKIKQQTKKLRDRFVIGVVLGLQWFFHS